MWASNVSSVSVQSTIAWYQSVADFLWLYKQEAFNSQFFYKNNKEKILENI